MKTELVFGFHHRGVEGGPITFAPPIGEPEFRLANGEAAIALPYQDNLLRWQPGLAIVREGVALFARNRVGADPADVLPLLPAIVAEVLAIIARLRSQGDTDVAVLDAAQDRDGSALARLQRRLWGWPGTPALTAHGRRAQQFWARFDRVRLQ